MFNVQCSMFNGQCSMVNKCIYIIGVALLLFASCGRQQQAKSSIKDFVETQLHRDASYIDFSSVDSTRAPGIAQ